MEIRQSKQETTYDRFASFNDMALSIADLRAAACLAQAAYELPARAQHADTTGLSPDQITQRKILLDLCVKLIEAERDKALDAFSTRWLAHRKLITQEEPTSF